MNKTQLELIEIAKSGASLVLDSAQFTNLELVTIAKVIPDDCSLHLVN